MSLFFAHSHDSQSHSLELEQVFGNAHSASSWYPCVARLQLLSPQTAFSVPTPLLVFPAFPAFGLLCNCLALTGSPSGSMVDFTQRRLRAALAVLPPVALPEEVCDAPIPSQFGWWSSSVEAAKARALA